MPKAAMCVRPAQISAMPDEIEWAEEVIKTMNRQPQKLEKRILEGEGNLGRKEENSLEREHFDRGA